METRYKSLEEMYTRLEQEQNATDGAVLSLKEVVDVISVNQATSVEKLQAQITSMNEQWGTRITEFKQQMISEIKSMMETILSSRPQGTGSSSLGKEKMIETPGFPQHGGGGILSTPVSNPNFYPGKPQELVYPKPPKIDFPYFSGEGVIEWVRKAHKYFIIYKTREEDKLGIAEMYIQGKAYVWYRGFCASQPNATWESFLVELFKRFGEGSEEAVVGAFCKIKQKGSVREYQEVFEDLKSHVMTVLPNAPESYYVSVFTSGLKEEIQSAVRMFKPKSLSHAFELSSLQETTTQALFKATKPIKPLNSCKPSYPTYRETPTYISIPYTNQKSTQTNPQNYQNTNHLPPITNYKSITPAELQAKKALGLCFKCNEKYAPGHVCKNRMLNFIVEEEEEESIEPEFKIEVEGDRKTAAGEELMHISVSALLGHIRHRTIQIPGVLKGRKITILISSGSTHSFVDEKLALELKYQLKAERALTVKVANGEKLASKGMYQPLCWKMHNHEFQFQMRTLYLRGSDMILGANWLSHFGPMLRDFAEGYISYVTIEARTHCDHLASLSQDLWHIPTPDTPCNRCQHPDENWLCLCCKDVLCSRFVNKHMLEHYQQRDHSLALSYSDLSAWCFSCDAYLDAQVILPLRPAYEIAYILKFGEASPLRAIEDLQLGDSKGKDSSSTV